MKRVLGLIMVIIATIALVGCTQKAVLTISESDKTANLIIGETKEITIIKSKGTVVWKSDNENIATVSNGVITAVSQGSTKVIVSIKDSNVYVEITVTVGLPDPTSVSITGAKEVVMGNTTKYTASVLPEKALQEVKWSTNNDNIATIDDDGNLTPVALGNVIIKATSQANNLVMFEYNVKIIAPSPTGVTITGDSQVELGSTLQLTAIVNPELASQEVTWSINDNALATISENGILTPVAIGAVKVTATSKVSSTIKVEKTITIVYPQITELKISGPTNVFVGTTSNYTAEITPAIIPQGVTWSVNDTNIVTVSETGVLQAKSVGTAILIATSKHDPTKSAQVTVNVIELTNDFLIDPNITASQTVEYKGIIFVEGLNAFSSLDKLNNLLKEGSKVYIKPGSYSTGFTVNANNVSILGPNEGINPNKATRGEEAIIKNIITISGVQGLVIDGIKLEDKGQIYANSVVKNITIKNIFAFEPNVPASEGIVYFAATDATKNEGVSVTDSLFNDSKSYGYRGVRINNAFNTIIKGNNFIGFFDSIRLEGHANTTSGFGVTGTLLIEQNEFSLNVQYPIYVTRYQSADILISNNKISTKPKSTGTFASIYLNSFVPVDNVKTVVNIKSNEIVNKTVNHDIRFNSGTATSDQLEINVNYNVFNELPYYDTTTSTYKSHIIDHSTSTTDFIVNGTENIFKYPEEVLPAFFTKVAYDPFYREEYELTMLYVNLAWSDTPSDTVVTYNGIKLVFGQRAFASLASAIEKANDGTIILLTPGTYNETLTISKNNITIISLNKNILPENHLTANDAIFTGKITISKNLKNFTINGLKFTGDAQIINQAGAAGTSSAVATNLDGFKFVYNNVETGLLTGKGFIYFVEGASSYSKNIEISYNKFTAIAESKLESIVYLDNNAELKVVGNKFENIPTMAFYVHDTTKGLAGNTYIQGNQFNNITKDALKFNWLSPLPGTTVTVKIVDNTFKNVSGTSIYLGSMNHADIFKNIFIQYNKFEDFNNGIFVSRVHAGGNLHVNYNIFQTVAGGFYMEDGKGATSPVDLDAINNLYMADGLVIIPDQEKFKNVIKTQTKYTSIDQVPKFPGDGIVLIENIKILDVEGIQYVGETYELNISFSPDNATVNNLVWETSDESIASVTNGIVTYLKQGKVTIKVYPQNNPLVFDEIEITIAIFQDIDVIANSNGIIYLNQELQLIVKKYPNTLTGDVTFKSLSSDVATVSETGVVKGLKEGEVVIEVKVADHDLTSTITLVVAKEETNVDPVKFLMDANISAALLRNINTFGNTTKTELTKGSVSYLWFNNIKITEILMEGRPKIKLTSTEFIVVHDTGNNNVGANALMHSNYLKNNTSTSWHYTVDDEGAYKHIPNDEVGYHAGDGLREFALLQTGVTATTPNPVITISSDGYYELNGTKSTIIAPLIDGRIAKTNEITPSGIYTEIKDGKYLMNKTYYNTTYKLISNHGGGSNGIGIESAVDDGSDLYLTWQNLAQLVADLLIETNLGINRVMQHNNFSGKNCPQTLRTANLWDHFIKMVEFEYLRRTVYKDYNFSFVSNNPTLVDNSGHIIKVPSVTTEVSYTVTITNNSGYNKQVTLYTSIPGLRTL